MASTREERLQMRQRGAGTRKIQQVDFGFSFGGQQGGLGDPAPPSLFPEPAKPPQEPPAPIATTPRASQSSSQTNSQSQRTPGSARNNVPQRASAYDIPSDDAPEEPRSSKRRRINPLNENSGSPSTGKERQPGNDNANTASNGDALPSKELETGDTTLPDAPPQPTIEAPEPPAVPTVPEVPADVEMQEAGNGETDDQNTRAEATQEENPVETPQEPQPAEVQPQEVQTSIDTTKSAPKNQRKSRSPPQADNPPSKETENSQPDVPTAQESAKEPAAAKKTQAPSKHPKKVQKPRSRSVNGDSSPGQAAEKSRKEDGTRSKSSDAQISASRSKRSDRPLSEKKTDEAHARPEPELEEPEIPEPEADQASNSRRGRPARKDKKSAEPESSTRTEQPDEAPAPSKPSRGRPARKDKSTEPESNTTAERLEDEVDTQLEKETASSKPSRGRPARKGNTPAEPESTTRPEEPEAVDVQSEKDAGSSKSSRGRPAKKDKKPAEPESSTRAEPEEEPAASKPGRGRPGRKGKAPDRSDEQPEAQPEPQPEPVPESSKSHRAKDGKRRKRTREQEPEVAPPEEQPAAESAPRPEPEQPVEEEPEDSRPSQQGSKRGRKGKKTAPVETTETTPTEEPAEIQPARERRKPREPRGETVPVTVHRLANSSALGMMYASDGSEDENEDSADELSTRQKTKLPKRGGVNPADVLGQICRETLEKTLTALKNGIENESNTQRRAEWTRKRKAVEAFGSELDGRLLDLSEMLDSNFVLGVQLKKEKRDMMDLRTHLYKVRKEREDIALQMDAVRAKHMEEEAAKTSRTTINNSLHSLELALDRTQHRDPPSAEPSSAELEFMLRTVADDVSCRAPGSQGGLLEQIRTFNAQLESTARRLEGQ